MRSYGLKLIDNLFGDLTLTKYNLVMTHLGKSTKINNIDDSELNIPLIDIITHIFPARYQITHQFHSKWADYRNK